MIRFAIVTVSDRSSQGFRPDLSGPALNELIMAQGWQSQPVLVVPDEIEVIQAALLSLVDSQQVDVILTTGGTGLGPRDTTPEVTRRFCDRAVPGLAELLRSESLKETPHAALSRATAGQRGKTLVVNLPGSVRGASFGARVLAPILPHAAKMMAGGGH